MSDTRSRLSITQWLVCILAAIGFAFDIYEILVLPLIAGPALADLGGLTPGTPEYANWISLLFYVPAVAGGAFGLVGGYLTDLLGRRRVLTFSILLYAFSAVAAGYATSLPALLLFRTTTFVGVCVEFVAAVAWLAELFPDPKQRESVLGYTQAFSSVGGNMVAGGYYLAVTYAESFPAIHGGHEAWRYTLLSGVIPAIPLILIRPFLPESPVWARKKTEGSLKRPSIAAIFAPRYARTTWITMIMFAMSYGAAFGAIQHMPRIVPGIPEVANLARPLQQQIVSSVQGWQEIGGLAGRILLAVLATRIVARRKLIRVFQIPGMIALPVVFYFFAAQDLQLAKYGIFICGLLTVAQFSFWGNYLPRMYPVHLRGTGESFAANIGGRMVGTSFAAVTAQLATFAPGASPQVQLATAAAIVGGAVYVVGFIASFWLPEPDEGDIQE
jgi:MFS family permease